MSEAAAVGPSSPRAVEAAVIAVLEERRPARLWFQPVVTLPDGVTVGFEALSRFPATDEIADPGEVLRIAWARRPDLAEGLEVRALQDALRRVTEVPPSCFLAVNLSPQALVLPSVREVIAAAPDLRRIVVEITQPEGELDIVPLVTAANALRQLGARIAVDDAGHASVDTRLVTRISPDMVKVDRSAVRRAIKSPAKRASLEIFCEFAARIGASTVAMGLESEDDRAAVEGLGFGFAQGWLFGRPGPRPEIPSPLSRMPVVPRPPAPRPARPPLIKPFNGPLPYRHRPDPR